jgi:hypothetical protein
LEKYLLVGTSVAADVSDFRMKFIDKTIQFKACTGASEITSGPEIRFTHRKKCGHPYASQNSISIGFRDLQRSWIFLGLSRLSVRFVDQRVALCGKSGHFLGDLWRAMKRSARGAEGEVGRFWLKKRPLK